MIRYHDGKPPVLARVEELGFDTFKGKYDLNIIACRNTALQGNTFRDTLHVVHHIEGVWEEHVFSCATCPGDWWLQNSKRNDGVAILMHDHQYRKGYTFGKHRGKYDCLVPAHSLEVWRDGNKDDVLDFGVMEGSSASVQIHKAGSRSVYVEKWSAGCLVLQTGFDSFMSLCRLQKMHGLGSRFTLTILEGLFL